MEQVRRGKVDVVVAFKLDRLARSLSHLAQMVAELRAHNVALACPSQGIDTTNANPCAQFQLNILAAVAEFERQLITERVNAGIAAAKQRGVRLGRPQSSSRQASAVQQLVADGLKAAEIGRRLKMPYSTTAELVRTVREQHPSAYSQHPITRRVGVEIPSCQSCWYYAVLSQRINAAVNAS